MIKSKGLFVFFLFFSGFSFSQMNTEFLGVLQLSDTLIVPYKLQLKLVGSIISGYSVTDTGGTHETKSYVKGAYNSKTNEVYFEEYGIEYTKSDLRDYDFCFIHFRGKVKNLNKTNEIEGDFKGRFSDGVECINGKLKVLHIEDVLAKVEKSSKKLERNKIILDSIKQKVNFTKLVDDQRLNLVRKNEKVAVFLNSEKIRLKIVDSGKLDGDRITLIYNGESLVHNYEIELQPKVFELELTSSVNKLLITAENLGDIHPNTVKITLVDGDRNIDLLTNLKTLETSAIMLHRK